MSVKTLRSYSYTLPKEELPALKKYVRSPFLHGQQNEYDLLMALLKLTNNFEKDVPDDDQIWKAMYGPDKPLKAGGLRRIISGLAQTVEGYMAMKAM